MNLRGQGGVQPQAAWPTSGHLSRGLGEIRRPSIFVFLPRLLHVFPLSSPPLSSTILSILGLLLRRGRDMTFSDRFHERLSHLSLPRPLSTYSHGPPPCAKIAIVMTKQSGLSRLMPLSSALHH